VDRNAVDPAGLSTARATILVTGATSGIGLETATALAATGATVVLAAHDRQGGERSRRQIATATGNENVRVVAGDLSSQTAVRQLVKEIQDSFGSLDVLINNAGVDVGKRQTTVDGLELTFAVNYMAPFLLTTGLMELLKANAPARVLNVVSSGYKGGRIDFDDLQAERRFSGQRAYNNSKLALVMFTYELARRLAGSGVTANAVDPGFVRGTGIGRTLPFGYQLIGVLMQPLMASVKKGADTIVWAATDPLLSETTGRYFKRRKELTTGSPTHDADLARRLWETSERLAHSEAAQ
jgi:NAD(P)-dependent dehydrogenase (short-subunit alcohol dehydrogenase family)